MKSAKNVVHIVNWILTRKCNLNCSYCGIIKNSYMTEHDSDIQSYPDVQSYNKEMTPTYVIQCLDNFKRNFPDCFHIFYGGEPLLYKGLDKIISYCNNNEIQYTIITNNSKIIQPKINELISKVGRLRGLTASIDPIIYDPFITEENTDRREKSLAGLKNLIKISSYVDDLVAEVTIDESNVSYIYTLIEKLTSHNISSSITFVDIKKTYYYDFSNVCDEKELVYDSPKLRDICHKMIDDGLRIHMGKKLLDKTMDILPSELDCGLEKYVHNLTIDADGSIRLCLRIRGIKTPAIYKVDEFFDKFDEIHKSMIEDKKEYCKLCNWTCPIMTKLAVEENMTCDILHR